VQVQASAAARAAVGREANQVDFVFSSTANTFSDPARDVLPYIALLRCIFGNPFRPTPLVDRAWLAWRDGTVSKLAHAIYEQRRFSDVPILADALEEAGCSNPDILGHCRQPGEHARGCWVVDLLLGKE
jgi:hypothetical protein